DAVAAAFAALDNHKHALEATSLRALFEAEPKRFERLSMKLGPILMDYSKTRVTAKTMRLLTELARAGEVEAKRDAM
ncbi:hypothetical protein ABTE26_21525, partial [Acinetobacter baumannii]